ncbi:TetR/AcrR family transcriptional regulator [Rhodococcus rhodnii]|uniref:TetR family transcriptional regulator n=2 Tax=Rhodococcus rhodnii TaxID=38312 RepID=R7WQ85_9NOCA|nr:TetR family transcriptional regulator [Rhodococcus rhodnii]EOM77481.1 TetR family transcriptional regulator [Rhodococcus rhodnii LMG 5362]TXG90355.1 TetR/AcrR family transcriptional regulator [Rhodococcus rhodnii]
MPRIAAARDAAEPSSDEQHARHQRMLVAAATLAGQKEFARVQMHDVARMSGVAIGTLYRYFPSKTHLFVAVTLDQVESLHAALTRNPGRRTSPSEAVYTVLVKATRALLSNHALSTAMIGSTSTANALLVPDATRVDERFRQILLDVAGVENPTAGEATSLRLLVHLWFGIVQSCLNGRVSAAEAQEDIRRGCELLLVGFPDR